jgi:maltose alpha-D-glucosyltransferase/alpha-amylase
LFSFTKRLIALRQQHPCFGRGSFELLDVGNRAILAYWREYEGERVLVLHNVTDATQEVTIEDRAYVDLLTDKTYPSEQLALAPYQYLWLV